MTCSQGTIWIMECWLFWTYWKYSKLILRQKFVWKTENSIVSLKNHRSFWPYFTRTKKKNVYLDNPLSDVLLSVILNLNKMLPSRKDVCVFVCVSVCLWQRGTDGEITILNLHDSLSQDNIFQTWNALFIYWLVHSFTWHLEFKSLSLWSITPELIWTEWAGQSH